MERLKIALCTLCTLLIISLGIDIIVHLHTNFYYIDVTVTKIENCSKETKQKIDELKAQDMDMQAILKKLLEMDYIREENIIRWNDPMPNETL